ncbi:hypothetical protein CspeluHIS016_0402530 [Cutaneotrichosporon spelunceum]|uniref:F-box domain-containing protein n=1 Tax=Cutaneotrichosporon spelunceum TaxID=1672016 RepID=A0AAD3TV24_9TREE|nr:hypothetical protein CspeluHIS016_0402530 [Cutaneotrichosporon spelunceum]
MSVQAAPNVQAGSPLAQLPAEVLTRITRWIPTTGLSAVRQTCKVIERKTFASWSHEFFRKRQFMISTFSLQTLLDIARHANLGPMVKHLCIATDKPIEIFRGSAANSLAAKRARQDQNYLLNTGVWIEMLTEAFKMLPNLETVDIRDFNSATRFRDGPDAKWYSYGSTTLFSECGMRPALGEGAFDLDRLFQGIVVAAGRAELTAPNLEVITRNMALTDAFYVSPAIKPAVAKYLGQLKKLHLVLHSAVPEPLEDFLHLAKNITWLRVNHFGRASSDRFLEWLSTPCNNDTMGDWAKAVATATQEDKELPIAPLSLPLDTLELGGCLIYNASLEGIVAKLPLRSLSMRRVQLCPDPKGNTTGLWSHFLESLEGGLIRRLHLSAVSESSSPGVWGQRVTFKGGRDPTELWLPARRYRREMFKSAAADTVVDLPLSDSTDGEDEGSEEDEDEVEEEDVDDEDEVDADGAIGDGGNGPNSADGDVDMGGDD